MKKLLLLLLAAIFFTYGCSGDDDDGNNPFGPDGDDANVSLSIDSEEYGEGNVVFYFKASTNIHLSKITATVPAYSYEDIMNLDDEEVYEKDEWYVISYYSGVESGQKWTFKFEGKTESNNKSFTVTKNYTVP